MKKLLKIRFVKFERAIATQVLEQEGFFKATEHIGGSTAHSFYKERIYLYSPKEYPFEEYKYRVDVIGFDNNAERDEYLEKAVKWISEEQFATGGKLEVGKMCEVSGDGKNWNWGEKRLVAVLPENFRDRYIVWSEIGKDLNGKDPWCSWAYARPIASCVQPKIDGDTYTWEMAVSE